MSGHTVRLKTTGGVEMRVHADTDGDREVLLHISTSTTSLCFTLSSEAAREVAHAITMAVDESYRRPATEDA